MLLKSVHLTCVMNSSSSQHISQQFLAFVIYIGMRLCFDSSLVSTLSRHWCVFPIVSMCSEFIPSLPFLFIPPVPLSRCKVLPLLSCNSKRYVPDCGVEYFLVSTHADCLFTHLHPDSSMCMLKHG